MSSTDPNLGALTDSPAYFPLNSGSPAIDAGDDAVCAAAPVSNTSQNGVSRPQGAHCDIGSYEADVTLTVRSVGTYDGWVLESGENTTAGGTLDKTATTFFLGDGAQDKRYRAILHFDTSSLPENAVITKVTLKIKKSALVGSNPFSILSGLKVDIRKSYFGTTVNLIASDFQAAVSRAAVGTFGATPVSNWYSAIISSLGYPHINKTGTTQFRLYFTRDDNNDDGADYMKFYSGNYATAASRPMLIIEYDIP